MKEKVAEARAVDAGLLTPATLPLQLYVAVPSPVVKAYSRFSSLPSPTLVPWKVTKLLEYLGSLLKTARVLRPPPACHLQFPDVPAYACPAHSSSPLFCCSSFNHIRVYRSLQQTASFNRDITSPKARTLLYITTLGVAFDVYALCHPSSQDNDTLVTSWSHWNPVEH